MIPPINRLQNWSRSRSCRNALSAEIEVSGQCYPFYSPATAQIK
jgi:ribosomal protein L31